MRYPQQGLAQNRGAVLFPLPVPTSQIHEVAQCLPADDESSLDHSADILPLITCLSGQIVPRIEEGGSA